MRARKERGVHEIVDTQTQHEGIGLPSRRGLPTEDQCATTNNAKKGQINEGRATHLLGHPPAKLPADAGLHGEHDVVHLDLARAPRVLRVHERVREHLRRVAVRELEQLVQHARLRVLHRRRRREQQRDRARARRDRVGRRGCGVGARHRRGGGREGCAGEGRSVRGPRCRRVAASLLSMRSGREREPGAARVARLLKVVIAGKRPSCISPRIAEGCMTTLLNDLKALLVTQLSGKVVCSALHEPRSAQNIHMHVTAKESIYATPQVLSRTSTTTRSPWCSPCPSASTLQLLAKLFQLIF